MRTIVAVSLFIYRIPNMLMAFPLDFLLPNTKNHPHGGGPVRACVNQMDFDDWSLGTKIKSFFFGKKRVEE